MSNGFRKGKIPQRFDGMTDEQILSMPVQYSTDFLTKKVDDQIVAYINTYFDTEFAAVKIIKKIELLEKALDKSCGLLANKEHYDFVNEKWIERTKGQWKEWCMENAD